MKKRLLSQILVAVLAASLLTGCQEAETTPSTGGGGTTESNTETSQGGTEVIDDLSVKKTINATLNAHPLVTDHNTNAMTLWMEETLNIDLEINAIPSSDYTEKMDIMMSTGEYPEVNLSGGYGKVALYGPDEGIIIPLDEYITEELTPNLLMWDEKIPGYLQAMRELDGTIYSIGKFEEAVHTYYSYKMWAYAPMIEEAGMEIPTTTDEFYDTLKAIKDTNPDYVPMMSAGLDNPFIFLANSFTYLTSDAHGLWKDGETIKTAINTDGYREALRYVNKLYEEGLLYNNSVAQTLEQLKALVDTPDNPTVAFLPLLFPGQAMAIPQESGAPMYSDIIAIDPLMGPDGVQYASASRSEAPRVTGGAFFITKDCPEDVVPRAMRLMDLLADEECWRRIHGVEGEHWEYSEEGKLGMDGVTPAVFNSFTGWSPAEWSEDNVSWINYFPAVQAHEVRMGVEAPEGLDIHTGPGASKWYYEVTVNQYEPYGDFARNVPTIKYTVDESNEFARERTDVEKLYDDSRVAFITGSMDIDDDAVWEKYVSDLDSMGLQDIIAQTQMGYDRMYG